MHPAPPVTVTAAGACVGSERRQAMNVGLKACQAACGELGFLRQDVAAFPGRDVPPVAVERPDFGGGNREWRAIHFASRAAPGQPPGAAAGRRLALDATCVAPAP